MGVSSVGGGGVALGPNSFSPVVSATVITTLIGVGEGALMVNSVWLLVTGSLVTAGVVVAGVAGVLTVVAGVAGAVAEAVVSGAKNFSVVP